MMDTIVAVVRNLIILAFLSLFLELLLPGGSTKRYAKFVMGLLVVLALLQPLLQLTQWKMPVVADYQEESSVAAAEEIVGSGEEIRENFNETVLAEYEKEIAAQIEKLVSGIEGVETVSSTLRFDGEQLSSITLGMEVIPEFWEQPEKIQEIREEAAEILSGFYEIETKDIRISISAATEEAEEYGE